MTTTRIYKTLYAGGIEDYDQPGFDIVISLIAMPKLPSTVHHLIAPLSMDLPQEYEQNAKKIVELLDLCLEKGWKALVHCYQGKVRSQGVIKAYAKLRDPENAPDQTSFSKSFFYTYLA